MEIKKNFKVINLIYLTILYILSIFVVFFIRVISFILVLRISALDFSRIGKGANFHYYLFEKSKKNSTNICLAYFGMSHANKFWLKKWKELVNIVYLGKLGLIIDTVNRKIPGYEKHLFLDLSETIQFNTREYLDIEETKKNNLRKRKNNIIKNIINTKEPLLKLNAKEIEIGKTELKKLNINGDSKIICFHARDKNFLNTVEKNFDWSYHDYRDSNILNYLEAANDLLKNKSYVVLRMGLYTGQKLEISNKRIIDYSNSSIRSDFMDIFLLHACRFLLCSDTGISAPAEVFLKPIVYVNWCKIISSPIYTKNGLVIYKKFYLNEEKRFMNFSEIMSMNFDNREELKTIFKNKIKIIENTPNEIRDVAIEMDERLNNTWKTNDEYEYLQNKFWKLFNCDLVKSDNLRIGSQYLKENQDLIQ